MAKSKANKAKARQARGRAAMTSPRIQKPRKSQTAVPLSQAARRRVRVATALMDYVAASIDRAGTVTVPADKIVAKDAEGSNAPVNLTEIGEFVERLQRAGKLAHVEKRSNAYLFKVLRRPFANSQRQPTKAVASRSPQLPNIEQMMRAVLAAIDAGAKRHPAVRAAVSNALAIPVSMARSHMSEHSLDGRLPLCIEHHKALGHIQREGRVISILPRGRARLQDSRPFEGDETPKKFRVAEKSLTAVGGSHVANSGDVSRLLQTIPTLPPERLIVLWSNAVKVLAAPSKAAEHERARQVIGAVETAWDALDRRTDEEFAWPNTEVRGGPGTSTVPELRSEGILSYLEYRVGKTAGLPAVVRHSILARVFEGKLPRVFDAEYMRGWGSPGSAQRLRKMAESLAAFARNAKRSDQDRLDEAIRQWEQDLEFLHDRYYVGRFGFGWPTTSINDPVRMLDRR
ncbi:hypothetical protein NKH57_02180 [Mesorhizobium sp. M1050]|uniref:hypothetical protein n=1 Tax=Mesorhizobium sp. M1050 TaxID=2957051 RepID=UPI003334BBFD